MANRLTRALRLSWLRHKLAGLSLLALFVTIPVEEAQGVEFTQPPPHGLTRSSAKTPLPLTALLEWTADLSAVAYEMEIFRTPPADIANDAPDERAIFRTAEIYTNALHLSCGAFLSQPPGKEPLFWRVRSLDLDRSPISPFSELAPLYLDPHLSSSHIPVISSPYNQGHGSVLLYPVYAWVQPADATRFEIALYDEDPTRNHAAVPIDRLFSESAECYDPKPRMGERPFFWRVRTVDPEGRPLSGWSKVGVFRTDPKDGWEVAVFGDSISHGGGRISYGPENLEYSWLRYLDFPAVNLSQSGDLTETMLARFEADVAPFHPRYLLIMGGTNDLRAEDFAVETAVEHMEAIKDKCRQHGIKPIFLTLPPVNPQNIVRAFDEPTDPKWREKFAAFNDYLRRQPHIDVAATFAAYSADGDLPEWLALDGLHQDILGKQLIAARVNAQWEEAQEAADQWLSGDL
ncbi:MAG: SGNH/GDSL hydrolase family protein [Schwartzia sp. (in: firmicutes)]